MLTYRQLFSLWPLFIFACSDEVAPSNPLIVQNKPVVTKNFETVYIVKDGDTLYRIGRVSGYAYQDLATWNALVPPYTLRIGQRLKLFKLTTSPQPPLSANSRNKSTKFNQLPKSESTAVTVQPQTYQVKTNDTLYSISRRLNISPQLLATWNQLDRPEHLRPGQLLKIAVIKQSLNPRHSLENPRDTAEASDFFDNKTSIISNNNQNMLKFYTHWPSDGKILKNFAETAGKGIEIGGKLGQAVKAAAAGKVVAIKPAIYGHGKFIVLQHPDHYLSSYSQTQRVLVKLGQQVKAGQMIAEMGRVGRNPPSVEFEIRKNGRVLDPLGFLPKKRLAMLSPA
jgi:lipoprotein NlpD